MASYVPYELPAAVNYENAETMVPNVPVYGGDSRSWFMPPVVIAAGIGAAGALGGAALSSRASGKASESQERSTSEALAFEREQAKRAEAAYQQQWMERQAMRSALLKRYGIDVPELSSMPAPGQTQPQRPFGGLRQGHPGLEQDPAAPGAAPVGGPPQGAPPGGMPPRGAGLSLGEMAMKRPFYEWNSFGQRG